MLSSIQRTLAVTVLVLFSFPNKMKQEGNWSLKMWMYSVATTAVLSRSAKMAPPRKVAELFKKNPSDTADKLALK